MSASKARASSVVCYYYWFSKIAVLVPYHFPFFFFSLFLSLSFLKENDDCKMMQRLQNNQRYTCLPFRVALFGTVDFSTCLPSTCTAVCTTHIMCMYYMYANTKIKKINNLYFLKFIFNNL